MERLKEIVRRTTPWHRTMRRVHRTGATYENELWVRIGRKGRTGENLCNHLPDENTGIHSSWLVKDEQYPRSVRLEAY